MGFTCRVCFTYLFSVNAWIKKDLREWNEEREERDRVVEMRRDLTRACLRNQSCVIDRRDKDVSLMEAREDEGGEERREVRW